MLAMRTQRLDVFERVLEGIGEINRYRSTRDSEILQSAIRRLIEAENLDPAYFFAPYYLAVAQDLEGQIDRAADRLEKLIPQLPPDDRTIVKWRVRLNLAVVQYHGYSQDRLAASIETLEQILTDLPKSSLAPANRTYIGERAEALLAQVYATAMIPDAPGEIIASATNGVNSAELARIEQCYERSSLFAHRVLNRGSRLARFSGGALRDAGDPDAIALARHALGLARMYLTDYAGTVAQKLSLLKVALADLDDGGNPYSRDPAKDRDLASCHLRIGAWQRVSDIEAERAGAESEFKTAIDYLNGILKISTPAEGFARFELGRVYRVKGSFDNAKEQLKLSRAIEESRRGVSTKRVDRELMLAEMRSSGYP
jgi:tetratricopeptide (TPR) repeat protein